MIPPFGRRPGSIANACCVVDLGHVMSFCIDGGTLKRHVREVSPVTGGGQEVVAKVTVQGRQAQVTVWQLGDTVP
jgi:hypothetical protein